MTTTEKGNADSGAQCVRSRCARRAALTRNRLLPVSSVRCLRVNVPRSTAIGRRRCTSAGPTCSSCSA